MTGRAHEQSSEKLDLARSLFPSHPSLSLLIPSSLDKQTTTTPLSLLTTTRQLVNMAPQKKAAVRRSLPLACAPCHHPASRHPPAVALPLSPPPSPTPPPLDASRVLTNKQTQPPSALLLID